MDDTILNDDMILNGYIDGELIESDKAQVSARIENDPAFAARLEALRRNDALIKAAYEQPMHEPAPAHLLKGLNTIGGERVAARHQRSTTQHNGAHTSSCWLLPRSVAKPIARLYRKHSR